MGEALEEILLWIFEIFAGAFRVLRYLFSPTYRLELREKWEEEGRLSKALDIFGAVMVVGFFVAVGVGLYLALS